MITNSFYRKITVAVLSLIIITIIYLFPTFKNDSINQEVKYIESGTKSSIYLIDKNDFVAKTDIFINKTNVVDKAKELITSLIIDSSKNTHLPNGFKAIIPKDTKINDLSFKDGILKVDFNNKFLETDDEEKMIEAIVYSLTTIEEIKEVLIFIDGVHLNKINDLLVPNPLTRDFGINKVYDIDNYKNITKTTIYYLSKYEDNYYYIPVTKYSNNQNNKVEIIIDELKSAPLTTTTLMSYLASSAELLEYEILEQKINMSFNEHILDDFDTNSILEEVKYTIGLSLKSNFDIEEINFLIDGKVFDTINVKTLE